MTVVIDTTQNSSFSRLDPAMQLAIDSTSLGAFKTCPRYYWYSVVLGFVPKESSVHLIFGLLMHGGVERYHHGKAKGLDHDASLDFALDWVLRETWDKGLNRPWISGDSYKNRLTLVRTLVWYLDQYGDNDPLQTIILANGKPAVELSFSFDTGFRTARGESILFCGHLDRLATLNGVAYIPDLKTSKSELNQRFWQQFNPSNQFGMYTLAGEIAFEQQVKGLIVDGAQVLVNSSRFARQLISKDQSTINEWFRGALYWVEIMEDSAAAALKHGAEAYPMNDKSCSQYGGCQYLEICSRSPGARQQWLEAGFAKRTWDPLQRRGDI